MTPCPSLAPPPRHGRAACRSGAGLAALLLATALAPALAQTAPAADTPPLLTLQGPWRIEQARTEPLLDKRQARLDFSADGHLVGHTSCNTLRASYRLDGDRLTLGPVVTTRMACAPLQMEQEDRVLSALEAAASARVRPDGLLELRDADGRGVLRATRLSATP